MKKESKTDNRNTDEEKTLLFKEAVKRLLGTPPDKKIKKIKAKKKS